MDSKRFKELTVQFLDKNKTLNVKKNDTFMIFCCENGICQDYKVRVLLEKLVTTRILKKKLLNECNNLAEYSLSDFFTTNRPVLIKKYTAYTVLRINNKEVVVANNDPILKITKR